MDNLNDFALSIILNSCNQINEQASQINHRPHTNHTNTEEDDQ